MKTQLDSEIKFLYNKFNDIINENNNYLLKNIPSFDFPEITTLRKNKINTMKNSLESILKETYNNISSITNLSKILLKDPNDFFEIRNEIKINAQNLLNSFSIPFKYIKNDISNYIPKQLKEIVKKNSILTKIYQGKYSLDILKKFSEIIAENDIMKSFKISDYISLFKEFILNNYNNFIHQNYLKFKFSLKKLQVMLKVYIFKIL